MARPRSLLGLLAYLVALHVRRRPALLAIVVVPLVTLVLLSRGRTTDSAEVMTKGPPLQAAVLRDGFAVLEAAGDRHLVELDRDGKRRKRSAIPTVTETRAIGMSIGAGVVWLQSKKMHVAKIEKDGTLGRSQTFGTSVRNVCYGVASNDHRWAVGWLEERDEKFWFVHGPTQQGTADVGAIETSAIALDADIAARMTWCAITSANDYVALTFRIEAKTYIYMCSKKECGGVQTRAPIDPRDEIMDIACQKDGCVMAMRARDGAASLVAFNLRGKTTWTKKLGYATRDTRVQLAAAGDRAYLASFMTEEGPVVERMLSKSGTGGRTWHGAPGLSEAAITWSRDYAMLAYWDGGALGTDVFAMPR